MSRPAVNALMTLHGEALFSNDSSLPHAKGMFQTKFPHFIHRAIEHKGNK
jgi:hypothetical protein